MDTLEVLGLDVSAKAILAVRAELRQLLVDANALFAGLMKYRRLLDYAGDSSYRPTRLKALPPGLPSFVDAEFDDRRTEPVLTTRVRLQRDWYALVVVNPEPVDMPPLFSVVEEAGIRLEEILVPAAMARQRQPFLL